MEKNLKKKMHIPYIFMNHLAVHLKLTQTVNQLYVITKIIFKLSLYILTRKTVFCHGAHRF